MKRYRIRLGTKPLARLLVRSGGARVELLRRGRVTWAAEAAVAEPRDLAEALGQMVSESAELRSAHRLVAELEPPLVQLRTLESLPPVRHGPLQELVSHQSARFFRRNGVPLVTAAVRVRRTRTTALVRAAAVGEPWVEAIIEGARAAGLRVEAIRPAGEPRAKSLDLLPATERRRRRLALLASSRRLAAVAVVLWCAVGLLYVQRERAERARVETRLAALAETAAAVSAARRELSRAAAMVEAMDQLEATRGRLSGKLVRIAAALPDSVYLTSLWLDSPDHGGMTGSARSASGVVAAMERSRLLPGVTLSGPVVGEVAMGREWERFTIRFGGGGP